MFHQGFSGAVKSKVLASEAGSSGEVLQVDRRMVESPKRLRCSIFWNFGSF